MVSTSHACSFVLWFVCLLLGGWTYVHRPIDLPEYDLDGTLPGPFGVAGGMCHSGESAQVGETATLFSSGQTRASGGAEMKATRQTRISTGENSVSGLNLCSSISPEMALCTSSSCFSSGSRLASRKVVLFVCACIFASITYRTLIVCSTCNGHGTMQGW